VFLKLAGPDDADLLTSESDGLKALAKTGTVKVPDVLAEGVTEDVSWLAIEWLDLRPASAASDARLGSELARLHRVPQPGFGWHRDNRIGLTPQPNTACPDWLDFFREQRLGFQLGLAAGRHAELDALGSALMEALPALLAGHDPSPSLLHGDLWGGNKARVDDRPVIFDPAVYCGDREADLAMTRLFGGFSPEFYAAYEEEWTLPDGHERRVELYKLYHVLNHFNLFGSGYAGQAIKILRGLLAAVATD
jgi:fructosamine-3-kinase